MNKNITGFTVVELLVVIAVIGILATIGITSFSRYQTDSRDSQRSSKSAILIEALEKYYDINGEYPGCLAVSGTASTVTTTVLPGVEQTTLLTPKSVSGDTNSIKCTDLTGAANEADIFAYVGDGSAACLSGQSCLEYTLKYKDEATGTIKTIQSRRQTNVATSGTSALTATTQGFTQINTSWLVIDNAASYELQRATDSGFTANLATQTVAATSQTVTGLTYNTQYYFRVRANSSASQGDWSTVASAQTWVLAQPTLTGTAASFTQINTSWGGITHATNYELQRATNTGFTANLTTQTVAGTSQAVTGLAYNTQYYFRVRANGGGFQGAWSATDSTATMVLGTPSISASPSSSTAFNTAWGAIPSAVSYTVQLSSDGTTWSTGWQQAGFTGTTGYFGGAAQGYRYYARIQAINGSYVSAWSNVTNTVTYIDAPGAFPLYSSNNLAQGWNYLNVASGASCPAGTSLSSDWYANSGSGNNFWTRSGTAQSYGLSWNTSVTITVATKCVTANAESGWRWADNPASMGLPWSTVWMGIPSYRRATWGATCPKWTTASTYDWWVRGNSSSWLVGENGVQTTAYDNQGIVWGDGDGRVAIHCYGPWGGDARSDGWTAFGSGCFPTMISPWCTY